MSVALLGLSEACGSHSNLLAKFLQFRLEFRKLRVELIQTALLVMPLRMRGDVGRCRMPSALPSCAGPPRGHSYFPAQALQTVGL